jgi:hypothetical protein
VALPESIYQVNKPLCKTFCRKNQRLQVKKIKDMVIKKDLGLRLKSLLREAVAVALRSVGPA